MPFFVRGTCDDHRLTVTIETAKEAFAKAVEWHIVEQFSDIAICEGTTSYTIAEFSSRMALLDIAATIEAHDPAM